MVFSKPPWPDWFEWELDCSNPHLGKRMTGRGFTETDLRRMLEHPILIRPDHVPGRWLVTAEHGRETWEIVVEPDDLARVLVVVTAYSVG